MNIKNPLLLMALMLCAVAFAVQAEAKDLIFHLGYDMVQAIDADTYQITDIPVKGSVRDSDFSADKKFLYVTGSRRYVEKIDIAKKRMVHLIKVDPEGWQDRFIFGMALAKDGKTAYVHLLDRKIKGDEPVVGSPEVAQIDLQTGKVLRRIEVPWGVANLALTKGDTLLYAIGQDIYPIDVSKKKMTLGKTIPLFDKGFNMLAFWTYTQENGGVWAGPYYTPTGWGLFNINISTGEIIDTPIKGEPLFAYGAVYSPDKTKAYSVMDEVGVIDLKTQEVTKVVPIAEGTCYGNVPTSDGKRLFVGAGGSTVTVYDTATMQPLRVMKMKTDGMILRRISY